MAVAQHSCLSTSIRTTCMADSSPQNTPEVAGCQVWGNRAIHEDVRRLVSCRKVPSKMRG